MTANNVLLQMPQPAYDTIIETLSMDADSHHIEMSLRQEIKEALSHITDLTELFGSKLDLPTGCKFWLVRATERQSEYERLIQFAVVATTETRAWEKAIEKLGTTWHKPDAREPDDRADEFHFNGGEVWIGKVEMEECTVERILSAFVFGGFNA